MTNRRNHADPSPQFLRRLAAPAIIRAARAQSSRQVSILTWNIPNAQPLMDTWIKDFTATRPGVSVQWLDKKGPTCRHSIRPSLSRVRRRT